MEDYSNNDISPGEQLSPKRRFMKSEFLMDWMNRLRPLETSKMSSKSSERPAPKLGKLAEMSYLAHDQEPVPKEIAIDSPNDLAVEGAALRGVELRRQRDETQYRRQLVGLKMASPNLETEQQQIIERQTAYGQEFHTEEDLSPKMTSKHSENIKPPLPTDPEARLQTIRQAQFKELVASTPEDKPEEILEVATEAAELNIPIEDMYERRHERKDESEDENLNPKTSAREPAHVLKAPYNQADTTSGAADTRNALPDTSISTKPRPVSSSIYKQAILAGFWTAILLFALVVLLLILTR
jgi:hypothetical protein